MALSMAALRAKLLADAEKQAPQGNKSGGKDNQLYPFWNIPTGSTAVLRFLPDQDETNEYFWRERQMINIAFPGIKGGDINKPVEIKVPCIEMWNEPCPVHAVIRPWFKEAGMEDMARKYWKKKSYLFNGFVPTNPLADDQPESPIRKFIINTTIFGIIRNAIIDPEMENNPTDYLNGTDFRLVKTTKGQYADYATSSWARKERSLNEQELEAIAKFGLYNLNDSMPKKPNSDELNAIIEMFEASCEGELYDPARWAQYYKPYGYREEGGNSTYSTNRTPAAAAQAPVAAAPVAAPAAQYIDPDDMPEAGQQYEAPVAAAPAAAAPKASVDDLLAKIRNRNAA